MSTTVRIATRKSPLALWQAEHVANRLRAIHPEIRIELVKMVTQGDKILDTPLARIGGKGLFVKELEQGLLEGRADLAVHSMKDVPAELPTGLHLAAILEREDARDAFVSRRYPSLADLPQRARIGTSSLRRQSQLKGLRPDIITLPLRGNVGTRLEKLDSDELDGIILAAAGLIRLNLANRITEHLSADISLPAVGQGAIGIECRTDDKTIHELIKPLHDESTAWCVKAERAFNGRLNGGCQVPIAGFAERFADRLVLRGLVASLDGQTLIRGRAEAPVHQAENLGEAVAEELLNRGADRLLRDIGI